MKLNKLDFTKMIWIVGKVSCVLTILFLGMFMLGHLLFPETEETTGPITPIDMIAMIFFPVGFFLGNVFSLKKEFFGSMVAVVSLCMFYLLIIIPRGAYRAMPFTLLLALPIFCNLLYFYFSKKHTTA